MTDAQPPVPPVPTPEGTTPPPATPAAEPAYPAYGQTPTPGYYAPPTNTLAIIALILGFLVPIGGIICGHIALNQIKRTGEGGRGLALAGLIIGYVFTAIAVLYIIGLIIFFAWMGTMGAYSSYPY
ncbi:MAG: DUF4190 domain-containing protein [Pseudolysinimonas sp.]|jgi:hypothetical protein|uniref:DUF4190 domain-containing protein n=1 Tax=Pseudolysinimonas sp. TaxID=2680009 RepID=UPI003C716BBC